MKVDSHTAYADAEESILYLYSNESVHNNDGDEVSAGLRRLEREHPLRWCEQATRAPGTLNNWTFKLSS